MLLSPSSAIDSERPPRVKPNARDVELARHGKFWRVTFPAMGSPCELLLDTDDRSEVQALASIATAEAWRIEDKFSRYISGNIVDRINTAAGTSVEVDPETAGLIDFAGLLYRLSDRRFDITSGALRKAWTFDGSDRLPDRAAVRRILRQVGWHRVDWASPVLTMPSGMQIDFGGIGKEYAVDKVAGLVREQTSSPCLVNFGGDLAITGPPGRQDSWQVGRESLQGSTALPVGLIQLRSGALATSGDTRRYLLKDGIRYGHILDPITGWPVDGAPASVTVAADSCVQAGMLCTLAMLRGAEAEAMLADEGVQYWCLRA